MLIWSHLMITTIVFGPRPEALAGTVLVDSFDYLNWIDKFSKGKVNLRLLIKNPEKFDRLNNSGLFWNIHNFLNSSFIVIFPVFLVFLIAYLNSNFKVFYFLGGWLLHIATDLLTHKDGFYPLFPTNVIKVNLAVLNYHHTNLLKSIATDILLFVIMLARLRYLGW